MTDLKRRKSGNKEIIKPKLLRNVVSGLEKDDFIILIQQII